MSVAYGYLGQLSIREGEQLKVKKGTDIRPEDIKKKVRNKYNLVSKRILTMREAESRALFKE